MRPASSNDGPADGAVAAGDERVPGLRDGVRLALEDGRDRRRERRPVAGRHAAVGGHRAPGALEALARPRQRQDPVQAGDSAADLLAAEVRTEDADRLGDRVVVVEEPQARGRRPRVERDPDRRLLAAAGGGSTAPGAPRAGCARARAASWRDAHTTTSIRTIRRTIGRRWRRARSSDQYNATRLRRSAARPM